MQKTVLITGANGFIATNFCKTFVDKYKFIEVSHKPQSGHITLDQLTRAPDIIKTIDVVINLAGANIGEKRWSQKRKELLISSRIETTRQLIDIFNQYGARAHIISASAIGIYPTNQECDENTLIAYNQYGNFSQKITRSWEAEAIKYKGKLTTTRFGVVLGMNGGAFIQMLRPFLFGLGGYLGDGMQYFSWIALPDLLNALDFIIENGDTGVVNLVAPESVTNQKLSKTIAKTWHRPCWFHLPKILIKLLFGQMGEELFLNSIKVTPRKLLATEFKYSYPTIAGCLQYLHAK